MTKLRWHEIIERLIEDAVELHEEEAYFRERDGWCPDPQPNSIDEARAIVEQMKAAIPEGHWTKSPPTKPGDYWVADRVGNLGSPKSVFDLPGREGLYSLFCGTLKPVAETWAGWWWSEPMPEPPKPPKWGDE